MSNMLKFGDIAVFEDETKVLITDGDDTGYELFASYITNDDKNCFSTGFYNQRTALSYLTVKHGSIVKVINVNELF